MTVDLAGLVRLVGRSGITPVAMESTGEYWTPPYTILEGDFTVFLVNAAQVKQVPGARRIRLTRGSWRSSCAMAGCGPALSPRSNSATGEI